MSLQPRRIILSALVLIMFSACSSSDERAKKGPIELTTDKIAEQAVNSIKTPIDQAKLAKELTEQHNSTIEKNVNADPK